MKIQLAVAVALALTLSGCAGKDTSAVEKSTAGTSPASSVVPASSATPTSSVSVPTSAAEVSSGPATAPAPGGKPNREFVVGKWGTNGNCDLAIELRADGTSDGPFGNWTYADGVISFTDEPDFKVNVTVIDDSTMESTSESSGKSQKMTRCP